ncbi:UDP-glucose 4-epimerase GalE [Desulfotomaculum defluvii]
MNILVCGGAGYIGSHTVRKLQRSGYEVLVLDNLSRGHRLSIGQSPLIVADINEPLTLQQIFNEKKIDAVMHFAAHSQVGESVEHPDIYYRNNVAGTLNVLDAMLRAGVETFIFSSTAAVYGEPHSIPVTEDHPTIPINPYGNSKLVVEDMLHWFNRAFGLKYVSLRYFNAAGADSIGDIGEDHSPETHLIPLVLQTALGQLPMMQVFGSDYPTPDGTCIRDYIHVNDLANAHLLALEYLMDGGASTVFNLGNSKGFSILEVIKMAETVTNSNIKYKMVPRRPGDPAVLVASSEKIQRVLGWQPQLNQLEDILKTAWLWHKSNPRGYKQ